MPAWVVIGLLLRLIIAGIGQVNVQPAALREIGGIHGKAGLVKHAHLGSKRGNQKPLCPYLKVPSIKEKKGKAFHPEYGTDPSTYYID
jgi:hypothetical protein